MPQNKLFMLLLGCVPPGRHTEQHDIYFDVAENLASLVPNIIAFWPEANGKIHVDAWREVTVVDSFSVSVEARTTHADAAPGGKKLFFINLGGYKQNEFEEYHYKMLAVADDKGDAIRQAKQTAFYKHTGFTKAQSHVDDKYGVDVDDIYAIEDILPPALKQQYRIVLTPLTTPKTDEMHLGYFKLDKL